ncbi:MAG: molybdopterin-dependent oxidoreductase [Lachnospiraceae bacterium]|nr:molybdopterin-dependent oxidoreductase [Lachnospiraceae bacterium]
MPQDYKQITKSVYKKDARMLLTGQAVYTNDLAPADCLIVKALRSPYPHALIKKIDTTRAMKVPGIACVITYKDVPRKRFNMAGQTHPELSAADQYLLEERLRYVGDEVAIVAGADEACVNKAMKLIDVKYEVLEPVLDPETAMDNPVLVHPEEDWTQPAAGMGDNKRNLAGGVVFDHGDMDATMAECDVIVEDTFRTQATHQGMMEPFVTFTEMDPYGRIKITSSTQIPFHVRRIVANALDIPKSKVRVVKPRVGGGFGAKQSACTECMPAIVTWKTGMPAKMVYTREECLTASNSRHEMIVKARMGFMKDGTMRAIDMNVISNQGAYGEHAPTTLGLTCHKAMTLYHPVDAYRFRGHVVYTNMVRAGAYRGYGATQGIFALESLMDNAAEALGMDKAEIRLKNMARQGDVMPAYYNNTMLSCTLDKCLIRAKEMVDWDNRPKVVDLGNGHVRALGIAMSLQGSGISGVDQAAADIRLSAEGFYSLMIGSADMGTGSDTTLSQIAAEVLGCDVDDVVPSGVDTDVSPYDSGSYASSTAYLTGGAVKKAAESLLQKMTQAAADIMGVTADKVGFDGETFSNEENDMMLTREELAIKAHAGNLSCLTASANNMQKNSPPPFMTCIAEVDVDMATGKVTPIETVGVVDCGTPLNERIVKVQTEGGIIQGLGMALYEKVQYTDRGSMFNKNFMLYKMPARTDIGRIRVDIAPSYEPNGPFGAKSIGEVVINASPPAIANAVYAATGVRCDLPITPEKVYMGMKKNGRIK